MHVDTHARTHMRGDRSPPLSSMTSVLVSCGWGKEVRMADWLKDHPLTHPSSRLVYRPISVQSICWEEGGKLFRLTGSDHQVTLRSFGKHNVALWKIRRGPKQKKNNNTKRLPTALVPHCAASRVQRLIFTKIDKYASLTIIQYLLTLQKLHYIISLLASSLPY